MAGALVVRLPDTHGRARIGCCRPSRSPPGQSRG
jgi:hypothetical protein